MELKPVLGTTTSFSGLTLLVGSFDLYKTVPEMTYNVFCGTLNPAQSQSQVNVNIDGYDDDDDDDRTRSADNLVIIIIIIIMMIIRLVERQLL